jgi:lipopolysaccharide/colanic/teichoic acid biosynthesis glycosyltransferase
MITRSKANKKASFNAKALSASPTDGYATWGKRFFDIAFATSVLLIFSPVYILIALIVAASSRGSILYIHERVGLNHQPFKCIKFRTMIAQADQALEEYLNSCPISRAEYEESFKLRHDPRITKIGKFLRKTSLDELPQFWNVLVGDMSVVGPRPLVQAELIKYGNEIGKVLSVRPGIAGLWQVSGRNDIPYAQRIKLDASYVRLMSFTLDMQLIFKTFLVVIFPKDNGAY